LADLPRDAFVFFFVDPKGWKIPLEQLGGLLARDNSEVIFNFMFDFINRAVSMKDPLLVAGLDALIPHGDWRTKLAAANGTSGEMRKGILIDAFGESLGKLGNYKYVAETTILRPLKDRTLYCLFYATRHRTGMEVFRDSQILALNEQSETRATTKVKHAATSSGQGEIFESLHDMGPDQLTTFLRRERDDAEKTILKLTPDQPGSILYEELWPQVLARHVVKLTDFNHIAAKLRADGKLVVPNWQPGKQVPHTGYKMQRVDQTAPKTTLF
jgi:hypothetical protein